MATLHIRPRWFIGVTFVAGALFFGGSVKAAPLLQVAGNSFAPDAVMQEWLSPPPIPFGPTPPTNQFLPDGAKVPQASGRAFGADQVRIYYAELSQGFGPSDGIHVIPIILGQFGGPDGNIVFPNPNPSTGIQDLDVSIVDHDLYALTGYPSSAPTVFRLSRVDGHVIGSPVVLQAPASPDSDGFTVLPNGNFLVNTGDESPVYQEFSSVTGAPVGHGFAVPCATATGVDAGFDSLVIQCDFNSFLVTSLTGDVLQKYLVTPNHIEDIEGIFGPPLAPLPEPASMALIGLGIACLCLMRSTRTWRQKKQQPGSIST